MRLLTLLLLAAALGCAGETFPLPSPASLQPPPKSAFSEDQQAQFIQIARGYVLQQGKDPTPVIYDVQPPRADGDIEEGDVPTEAVVVASFHDGNVWRLALKSDGTIRRITKH